MGAHLTPYLHFRGQAREAMEFYAGVFGAELTASTFAEFGGMGLPDEEQGNLMHGQLAVEGAVTLMGSDTPSSMPYEAASGGITLALSGDDEPTLRGWWDGLGVGGTVELPMELAPWGDYYGQLVDRYGVSWMVNCAGPANRPS